MRLAAIAHLCATILTALTLGAMAQTKAPDTPPPYEPQMMRLAEILGGLSWLRNLCGHQDGREWQTRMKQVMDAENPDDCLLYTSPSPRDGLLSRMPSSA